MGLYVPFMRRILSRLNVHCRIMLVFLLVFSGCRVRNVSAVWCGQFEEALSCFLEGVPENGSFARRLKKLSRPFDPFTLLSGLGTEGLGLMMTCGVIRTTLLLLSLVVLLPADNASAASRVALVIGNAQYAHAPKLNNPRNDARDVGAALGRMGFTVTRVENADRPAMWRALQEFSGAAAASDTAVVFYAGHGIEVDQRNFLVPVDARLASDWDVEREAVPLDLLMRAVERAKRLRVVILDACRDNPFSESMQRAGATRSIGRGLAPVEPSGGTLVAYAAKGGTPAADGQGPNSPYSAALLRFLEEPGLDVGKMFRKVHDAVLASTGGVQEPFVYGSLSGEDTYLGPPPGGISAATSAGAPVAGEPPSDDATNGRLEAERLAVERTFWESIKNSDHPADFLAYKEKFPGGTYEALADNRLNRLSGSPESSEDQVAAIPATPEQATPPASGVAPPSAPAVVAKPELNRSERRQVQEGLASLGFNPGFADGMFGPKTQAALLLWQKANGFVATGSLTPDQATILRSAGEKALGETTNDERQQPLGGNARDAARAIATVQNAVERKVLHSGHAAEALSAIASAQAKVGALQDARTTIAKALRAMNEVEEPRNRAHAFASIAVAQAQVGAARDAEKSISAALAAARRIQDAGEREFALLDIAKSQAGAGMIREALATAAEMEDSDWVGYALASIAKAEVEAGRIRDAVVTAEGMEDVVEQSDAFRWIAGALAEAGQFQEAVAIAQKAGNFPRQAGAFVSIAKAQAVAGMFSEALATVRKIQFSYYRDQARALSAIALAQARAGKITNSLANFRSALEAAERENNEFFPEQSRAFSEVALAQAQAGQVRNADRTFARALQVTEEIEDDDARSEAFGFIAAAQAKAGRRAEAARSFARALEIAREIDNDFTRADVLLAVASAQAEAGNVHDAAETADRTELEKVSLWAFAEFMSALAEHARN